MPTALAGFKLTIRSPRSLEGRVGDELALEVDLELAEPWIRRPRLGRPISTVDGEGLSALSLAFECHARETVPALFTGTARVSDTRIDVHTPRGFPDAGAGRGCEVELVSPGGLRAIYGHLARGSGKSGPVKVGDSVGTAGNTGRCVDGCGRDFVDIEVMGARHARSLDELCEPISLELLLDRRPAGTSEVPAGEAQIKSFKPGRVRIPRDAKRACQLELRLVRRRSALVTVDASVKVHV